MYLLIPLHEQDVTQINQTSCYTKVKVLSQPYYLLIAAFISIPRVLVLYEMQSASSKIWNRFTGSISNDGNHYTTGSYVCI